jgi:hypothetical protein
MELPQFGKTLMLFGAILVAAGMLLTLAGKVPFLGRLPGDFVWKRGSFSMYFPLATSILLSIVVTLILYVISRFTGR